MDGQAIRTFALITTDANDLVGQVHTRMPVILPREKEKVWLAPDMVPEQLLSLLTPYPAEQMKMYEISSRVNRVTEDVPELIKPIREEKTSG